MVTLQRGKEFQSTLPSRGATFAQQFLQPFIPISIHAPLAGSDPHGGLSDPDQLPISIHAPLAGSDPGAP